MFNIPIQSLRFALRPLLGDRGAREIIISDLGTGALRSRCKNFNGLNPSKFTGLFLPDQAKDLEIPPGFWSSRYIDEGESHLSQHGASFNFRADWGAGNFSVSGTYASGRIPFSRCALDVHLDRSSAMARLEALNVGAGALKAIPAPSDAEMLSWLVARLRTEPSMSQNLAERLLSAQFPGTGRPLHRDLFKQAKQLSEAPNT